jgi:hypothetical protein
MDHHASPVLFLTPVEATLLPRKEQNAKSQEQATQNDAISDDSDGNRAAE